MLCKSYDKEMACRSAATMTVFWPGKTTEACDRHAEGLRRVASAMGFALDIRPIQNEMDSAAATNNDLH